MILNYAACISWQEYHDTVYVFNEKTGLVYLLTDSSKDFWLALKSCHDIKSVTDNICQQYACPDMYDGIQKDFIELSRELQNDGILEVVEEMGDGTVSN